MTPCLSSRGVREVWEGTHAVRSPFEAWSVSYGNEQVWGMLGQEQAIHTQNMFLDKNETFLCCKCVEQEMG